MWNRVLFVERSGELRWLARLSTKGVEPKEVVTEDEIQARISQDQQKGARTRGHVERGIPGTEGGVGSAGRGVCRKARGYAAGAFGAIRRQSC